MNDMAVAALDGVRFAHVPGVPVLVDVELTVARGEHLAIVGPNGGGKTTLLRLLAGLLEPDAGRVEIFGQPPARCQRRIGYVPQHSAVDLTVPASALDVVLMGCLRRSAWGPRFSRDHHTRAREALDRVGLGAMAARRLRALSGGQRQRVLIARALVTEPELLLLDEPTSGVDPNNEAAIMASLNDLETVTAILVSHDLELMCSHCDRIVHVDGRARPWMPSAQSPNPSIEARG